MSNRNTTTPDHAAASAKFLLDQERANWHDQALWFIRQKRDVTARQIPDWEQLRNAASQIKQNVLANLDDYLIQFEKKALENGIKVHWAADGAEHNRIVLDIIQKHGVQKLVKSKSMLTEECHLNDFLTSNGIDVVDTDLGERIVQLAKEPPSHIVLPSIHKRKEEVGEIFHQHLGTEKGASDPAYLTESARQHLREKFLTADLAITGVNFAIAETGGLVVCTNEGNADMGVHLAKVHIACMGIEKIIPKAEHLGVFLRLLARSATGQPITTYSSHFHKPRAGQEMHLVLVDNGRSTQLGRPHFYNSLKCIRCGACINTCPVYRRSGGHSYHNTIAGPIGAILAPNADMRKNADLPFASTLCGSCTNVCPVKIDIHNQLYQWRQVLVQEGHVPKSKAQGMKVMANVLSNPRLYRVAGKSGRLMMRMMPGLANNKALNPWAKQREMPQPPKESFRDWYLKNRSEK
ncbi:LutB/LldF family L-lactate oxidation iron-sulfur protein [Pontibacter korlensis]|uniref:4Fe-4S ferredoxin n=1 Tax=Pontibacter korlensis TaxID=400092 RepID=A0A0E3ZDH7_9BACT|nr:LutB/LldF family L-lactate oxidation iron-sulfur protein [Pontibacter korlensis]AKD02283.1 4Fe-4S ferredoxin [Pontibacter korlensis]